MAGWSINMNTKPNFPYIKSAWFFNKEPVKCYHCDRKLLYVPGCIRDRINDVQKKYIAYEKDINIVV